MTTPTHPPAAARARTTKPSEPKVNKFRRPIGGACRWCKAPSGKHRDGCPRPKPTTKPKARGGRKKHGK